MFLSFLSHLLCAWFALALPAYATYKALTHAPDTLPTLAMYWTVLALFLAFEHSLGLVLSWLPFYWEIRTLFLLYISLPQTQGSTYVYTSFLEPWCSKNEADIDATVASAHSNAISFCRTRIAALVDLVSSSVNKSTRSHPDTAKGLWATYSPSLLAAFGTSDGHVTTTAGNDVAH